MKCPKCAYERKPTDHAPDYECPSCGIIYAKYKPKFIAASASEKPRNESGIAAKILRNKAVRFMAWSLGFVAVLLLVRVIFGESFTGLALLVAFAALMVWLVLKAIEGSRQRESDRQSLYDKQPFQHCMTCGHDFKPDRTTLRGSNTLEIALWILILWPIALIYSIWRRLGAGKAKIACIVCASNQVIPETSPAAIAHKKSLGIRD